MNPSTMGWLAASLLVPIGAGIAIAVRKPSPAGDVQTYPAASRVIMFLFGAVALALGFYLVFKGQDQSGAVTHWLAVAIAFVAGIGAMLGAYFYGTYSVIAEPDRVTVVHPFRGTQVLTRHNVISVEDGYFKGVRYLDVVYRDGGRNRKIRFDRARFDVTPFFGPTA